MKQLVLSTALLLTVGTSFGMSEDIFARQHPSEVTEVAKGYHLLATMPETKEAIQGLVDVIDRSKDDKSSVITVLHGMTVDELSRSIPTKEVATETYKDYTVAPEHGLTMEELVTAIVKQDAPNTSYDGARVLSVLDTKLTKRLRFFKRIHNWHGDNQLDRSNRHEEVAALASNETAEKGSYAWYVLKDLRHDILANVEQAIQAKGNALTGEDIATAISNAADSNAKYVKSEELRYYMNELVWYSVTETTKQLGK